MDDIYLGGTQQMRNEIIYLISDSICSSDRHGSLLDHLLYILLEFEWPASISYVPYVKVCYLIYISLYPSQIFI